MSEQAFEDAIHRMRDRLQEVAGVRTVILYGSAARGTATEGSDLDLLILGDRQARQRVLDVAWQVEKETGVRVSPVFLESLKGTDEQMLDTLLREGIPLVGELPDLGIQTLALEPWRLVRFDLSGLEAKEKVRVSRTLYGYRTRKKENGRDYVYEVPGFLARVGGRKVGRGAFLVPERAATEADRILRAAGASRILMPVWLQRA